MAEVMIQTFFYFFFHFLFKLFLHRQLDAKHKKAKENCITVGCAVAA